MQSLLFVARVTELRKARGAENFIAHNGHDLTKCVLFSLFILETNVKRFYSGSPSLALTAHIAKLMTSQVVQKSVKNW